MWKTHQLAYLAGIMDGEGTFYIGKTNNKFNSRMYVVNTNEKLIQWLKGTFGGLTYSRKSLKNPQWKIRHEWIIEKSQIDPICHVILPFLIIKKEHAELMIKFRQSFTNGKRARLTKELIFFRDQCWMKMKKLNHRSTLSV